MSSMGGFNPFYVPPAVPMPAKDVEGDITVNVDFEPTEEGAIAQLLGSGLRIEDPKTRATIVKDGDDFIVFKSDASTASVAEPPFESPDVGKAIDEFQRLRKSNANSS